MNRVPRTLFLSIVALMTLALVGNPNAGKTAVFNRLTGVRAKSSNYPGTTLECRNAELTIEDRKFEILDLPGLYSLDTEGEVEEAAIGECDVDAVVDARRHHLAAEVDGGIEEVQLIGRAGAVVNIEADAVQLSR